jgi:ribosomal-protein-alanine N-acetyltransferase
MIGNGGFHKWEHLHRKAELGYWILPEYQGKGLAAEAISAMITHGFENMALHRIEAEVETENAPSSRILRKMGFELEGIKKECEYINGRFIDLEFWAKLNI